MKLSRKRPVVKSSGSEASASEDQEKKQSKISKFFSKAILPSVKLEKPLEAVESAENDPAIETENDPPNDSEVIEQTPDKGLSGRLSKLKKFSKISLASARSSSRIVTSTPTDPPISKRPKLGSPKLEMMPKISPVLASRKPFLKLPEESSFERPTNIRKLSTSPDGKTQPQNLSSPGKEQLPVCVDPFQTISNDPPLSYKYGRHKVLSVNRPCGPSGEIALDLKNFHDKTICKVILRGSWVYTSVNEGDIINLLNVKESSSSNQEPIIIDDLSGLLIVHPDLLLSGTSIVSSLFCMRKAVLNERFKGLEGSNRTMFVGTFVHILMQECLRLNCSSKADVQTQFENVLKMPAVRQEMLMLGINENDLKQEVDPFLPHITFFIERYVVGRDVPVPSAAYSNLGGGGTQRSYGGRPPPSPTVWPGRIEEIKDIEENIWSPRLGIKGKVDMTVQVKLHSKDKQGRISKTIPLELKTGRPSGSVEHRGQVIMYSMMMAERRPDPESGLLLYLRTSSLQEIQAGIHDIRGLVQLRNQLATHLKCQNNLPDTINLRRSCEQCGQLSVCALLQKTSNTVPESPHAMAELVPLTINHTSEEDLKFFEKWHTLIGLETEESMKVNRQKNLWCQTPKTREINRRAVANLDLSPSKFRSDEIQFVQTFTRIENLPLNVLRIGDSVLVSTDKVLNLSQGVVKFVSTEKISLCLDKDLSRWKDNKFHVDILEYQQSFGGINLTNLARIMDNTERALTLRNIIVSGIKKATFLPGLPKDVAFKGKQILRPLNRVQQRAIFKTLMANDFVLIKGFPGSGKTTAIVALIRLIVALGKTVLLTSYTHAAVDNVLVKLLKEDREEKVSILRVGQPSRIHNDILPYSAEVLGKHFSEDVGQLRQLFDSKPVVASTCLGINHPAIAGRTFDYCIFDEAGQSLMLSTIGPLFHCRKFVLVGDPEQLPPVVQSAEARVKGLEASLFAHLESPENVIPLTLQYRMNRDIQALANYMTYKGQLECGSEEVSERSLHRQEDSTCNKDLPLIETILDCQVEKSVIFVDTSGIAHEERLDDQGICNDLEAKVVCQILNHLNKYSVSSDCYKPPSVGIIAPYRSQVANLQKNLERMGVNGVDGPNVSTVDQFQGRDQDVIIYSCTRTKLKAEGEKTNDIMSDARRLNVAVTRAKVKLIIIGHSEALLTYAPFKLLIDYLKEKEKILKIDIGKLGL